MKVEGLSYGQFGLGFTQSLIACLLIWWLFGLFRSSDQKNNIHRLSSLEYGYFQANDSLERFAESDESVCGKDFTGWTYRDLPFSPQEKCMVLVSRTSNEMLLEAKISELYLYDTLLNNNEMVDISMFELLVMRLYAFDPGMRTQEIHSAEMEIDIESPETDFLLQYQASGLEPDSEYQIELLLRRAESKRPHIVCRATITTMAESKSLLETRDEDDQADEAVSNEETQRGKFQMLHKSSPSVKPLTDLVFNGGFENPGMSYVDSTRFSSSVDDARGWTRFYNGGYKRVCGVIPIPRLVPLPASSDSNKHATHEFIAARSGHCVLMMGRFGMYVHGGDFEADDEFGFQNLTEEISAAENASIPDLDYTQSKWSYGEMAKLAGAERFDDLFYGAHQAIPVPLMYANDKTFTMSLFFATLNLEDMLEENVFADESLSVQFSIKYEDGFITERLIAPLVPANEDTLVQLKWYQACVRLHVPDVEPFFQDHGKIQMIHVYIHFYKRFGVVFIDDISLFPERDLDRKTIRQTKSQCITWKRRTPNYAAEKSVFAKKWEDVNDLERQVPYNKRLHESSSSVVLPFSIYPPVSLRAEIQPHPQDITIAVAVTADRIIRLARLAAAYKDGPVSAAVHVKNEQDVALVYHNWISNPILRNHVNITLIRETEFSSHGLLPINYLRNTALNAVVTEFVLLLDVDLLPLSNKFRCLRPPYSALDRMLPNPRKNHDEESNINSNMHKDDHAKKKLRFRRKSKAEKEALKHQNEGISGVSEPTKKPKSKIPMIAARALLVPIFLSDLGLKLPMSKDELMSQMSSELACPYCFSSQKPTKFEKWYKAWEAYEVRVSGEYEPYAIMRTSQYPRFDERFVGYGFNKVQWAWTAMYRNVRMYAVPDIFATHMNHLEGEWVSHIDERQYLQTWRRYLAFSAEASSIRFRHHSTKA